MLHDDKGVLPGVYMARLVEVHVKQVPSERLICALSIDGPIAVEVTEHSDEYNTVAERCYRVGAALLSGYDKLTAVRMSLSRTPGKVCAHLYYDVSPNQPGENHPDHRIHMELVDLEPKVDETPAE